MSLHSTLRNINNHAITASEYVDIAARDANALFHSEGVNLNKVVRVDTPLSYYILTSNAPTWVEITDTGSADTLAEILALGNTTGGSDIIVDTGDKITLNDAPIVGLDATNKTYVDAQVGANNELSEILANGNTTGGTNIVVSTGDVVTLTDAPVAGTDSANKDYVDAQVGASDELSEVLAVGNTSGANDIIVNAGQGIVIGGGALTADVSIELKSTSQALIINRLTTVQRDALTPAEGMIIWNTDTEQTENYDGVSWVAMSGGDVSGPASSLDNEVPSFNGLTGKNIQAGTQVFITDTQRLGVGTSNPADRLEVNGAAMIRADFHINTATRSTIFPFGDSTPTDVGLQVRSKGTDPLELNTDNGGNVILASGGGLVGIGTLSPAFRLDVNSDLVNAVVADFHANTTASIRVRSEAGKTLQFLAGTGGSVISASASSYLAFAANSDNDLSDPSNEVMRLTNVGGAAQVGIGTTSPGINAALQVEGGQIITGGGVGSDGALFSTTDTLVLGNTGAVFTVGIHEDKVGIGLLNPTRNLEVLGDGFFTSDLTTQGDLDVSLTGNFGGNITSDGRRVTTDGSSTTEIFTMADFPAPISGVITLPSGNYIVKENIVTGDRFEIEAGSIVTIEVDDSHGQSITYTGDVAAFTSVDYTRIAFDKFNLLCTGTNASAFSFTGSGAFTLANGRVILIGSSSALGIIEGSSVFALRNFTLAAFAFGFNLVECQAVQVQTVVIQPSLAAATDIFNFVGTALLGASVDLIPAILGPGTALFNIDPIYGQGISISNISKLGPGPFFRIGTTGVIVSFSDQSRAGVIITQVAGSPSLGPSFESVAHGLSVGEIITQSGFAVSEYNGTFVVSEIVDPDFYNLKNAVYNGNHDGVFDTTTTRTAAVDPPNEGVSVNIVDTNQFNGGYTIFNTGPTGFEFSLGAVFPGSEAGNWNTNSLDETSKFVNVTNAGTQKSSQNRAFGQMNGNALITTIVASDTYQEVNLDAVILDSSTELWTLIDPLSGIFRYDGLNTFVGDFTATVWALKAGSTQNLRFTISIDTVIPVFASAFYSPMEIKATKVGSVVLKPLTVVPGQTVQIMAAEEGSNDNITITDIAIDIVGMT